MKGDSPAGMTEINKAFVIHHFEEFVNNKNADIAHTNFSEDFLDHDEQNGPAIGPQKAKDMMLKLYANIPDIHVSIQDIMAEDDRVVVRNIWTGTNLNGQRISFRGFVLWKIRNGQFSERWATVTPLSFQDGAHEIW